MSCDLVCCHIFLGLMSSSRHGNSTDSSTNQAASNNVNNSNNRNRNNSNSNNRDQREQKDLEDDDIKIEMVDSEEESDIMSDIEFARRIRAFRASGAYSRRRTNIRLTQHSSEILRNELFNLRRLSSDQQFRNISNVSNSTANQSILASDHQLRNISNISNSNPDHNTSNSNTTNSNTRNAQ